LPAPRQLGIFPLIALALILTLLLAAMASFLSPGIWSVHRPLIATLLVFACYLSLMLVFAARGVLEVSSTLAGSGSAWLLAIGLFFLFVVYALGTGTTSLSRLAAMAAFLFIPLLLLSTSEGAAPGSWQDFITLAVIWAAVKFGPTHWVWPYPDARLAYIFTAIVAVNLAIAGFLLLRKTKNVGYNIGWGRPWALYIFGSLAVFAAIAVPLGMNIHFIAFSPRVHQWKTFLPLALGILFFTAWPEELLFRGLLQNLLSSTTKSPNAGWIAASILFGFSHITNLGFPNWRYVLLASIAGLFYGWTWRKTGSVFGSAIVHGCVDTIWHFLFRTL
jgi:membrane protease YdiL (CAAX protease family)